MKLHLETGAGRNIVRGYLPGRITVNQASYRASLVVLPDGLIPDWPPQAFAELRPEHFEQILSLDPEVVVLGTGRRLRLPAPELLLPLTAAGIGLEAMDTGAACRTYNILMGEGRRVAAALLMIEPEERETADERG